MQTFESVRSANCDIYNCQKFMGDWAAAAENLSTNQEALAIGSALLTSSSLGLITSGPHLYDAEICHKLNKVISNGFSKAPGRGEIL